MKEMLLMAASSIPEDKIDSVKSGFMKTLHQLSFAQKMSVKLIDDEDDVVIMGLYSETDEIIICPVTLNYSNGKTNIRRELIGTGFSFTRFIENLDVKELINAISEKNDVKQLQMFMDAIKLAKEKSQITETVEDVEESKIENGSKSEPEPETNDSE